MCLLNRKIISQIAVGLFLMVIIFLDATFAQRRQIKPPRVEGQTVIGTIGGVPVTANDIIMTINYDSPFMPPLDGSPVPLLQQFEANIRGRLRHLKLRRLRLPRPNPLHRASVCKSKI